MKLLRLLTLLCLPFFAAAQSKDADFKSKGSPIPPFVLEKVNGTTIDNRILKPGKPVMLMIVSPGCDHCEHMIDSVKRLIPRFVNTQVVVVTEARNKPNLGDFMKKMKLDKLPLFQQAGYDKSNLIFFIYSGNMLPQISFYNSKHKLVRSFSGNFPVDSLRSFIN